MSQPSSDSLLEWMAYYLEVAVQGVRSTAVTEKVRLHLRRFRQFFEARYGQERLSSWVKRDSQAWQQSLAAQGLAPATINNHMASLSAFGTWLAVHQPHRLSMGDPQEHLNQANCLNLITNAITVWNTVYMQAALEHLKAQGEPIAEDDLMHLSPARFGHINLYGKFSFEISVPLTSRGLRPLVGTV